MTISIDVEGILFSFEEDFSVVYWFVADITDDSRKVHTQAPILLLKSI
jgi:hypothetical protein